ncbi:MAG TPA: helix-turn-helix transcriptional regulator [Gemmatimonadaceae bacterium]|nr:helix-turn-helix transcriptional regulator [Gemmatimonadaceae bacterium]
MDTIVRGVKRACSAGLDSLSLRRELARRLAPVLGFDGHAFSTCDPDTGLTTHTLAEGVPAALGRAYVERIYPEVSARLSMDMARSGQTVYSLIEQSAAAREEFGAVGLRDQVGASLTAEGHVYGTWCLMWERGDSRTMQRARMLLRQIVPHLVRGMRCATLVDRGLSAHDAAAANSPGILVLDARNRPTVRTPVAERWLADLCDEGFRPADQLPLSVLGLVARVRNAPVDVVAEMSVRVRGRSGRWYVMIASIAMPDVNGDAATVVVVRPAGPREMAPILTTLYALSAREREVIAAVARGETTKEIAASLGLSPHTVAEHIERACRKIGVRGRKALVAKIFVDGYAPRVVAGMAPDPPARQDAIALRPSATSPA